MLSWHLAKYCPEENYCPVGISMATFGDIFRELGIFSRRKCPAEFSESERKYPLGAVRRGLFGGIFGEDFSRRNCLRECPGVRYMWVSGSPCIHATIMICATLVNTQTHTQTAFTQLSPYTITSIKSGTCCRRRSRHCRHWRHSSVH